MRKLGASWGEIGSRSNRVSSIRRTALQRWYDEGWDLRTNGMNLMADQTARVPERYCLRADR